MMSAPQDFFGFTTCIAVLAVGLGTRAGDQFRMLDGKQIRAATRPLPASIGEAIVPAASSAVQ
jgi:hypothetical protein